MAGQLFAVFLALLAFALTASGFLVAQYALLFWILAAAFGVASVGVWLWERRRNKDREGASGELVEQLLEKLETGVNQVSFEQRDWQIVKLGRNALEIRNERSVTVAKAMVDSGDVVVTPPTAHLLVGEVVRMALAERATGVGQAFDATVDVRDRVSRPEEPQSPESSKRD